MSNNYVAYHVHSDLSLLDSCTDFKLYIDKAKELGQKAIAISEHGKVLQWVAKKMYCDKVGIKYLHAVECYLTESLSTNVRDNYHTILIAKNYDGVKEINAAISKAYAQDHFYYVGRMTFDEFFALSDNVIKISACIASPLNKLDITHAAYERLVKAYDYLEIQPHNHPEQKAYNIHLATLSKKYNKPLIAGTDAHSLNEYKAECRKVLMQSKQVSFDDEDQFDLTYKSYDQLVEAFRIQNALPEMLYMQAIENTNVMADSVQDFEIDMSLKYPILYGTRENDSKAYTETIQRKFKEKIENGIIPKHQYEAYLEALEEEQRVFHKIEMEGYILSMSEIISWCKENGIPVGPGRGSVAGSRTAYVADITDLNAETWKTVFSRFCNEHRKEVGDIDVDVIESDRPKIFNYIRNRFSREKTARVPSFGTCAEKATIELIGRAFNYPLDEVKKIKTEFEESEQAARARWPQLFYFFDGLVGTKISQSIHPAGIVISPITLYDHYGVFDKDGEDCLMIDMDEIHEIGLVKYDFLILSNIQIIKETCELAGIPYPKSHEIDWDDQNVWNDMLKSPIGIFQMEGNYAFTLLKQFKPTSIFEMALVTACIRPSGASYRDHLIARKVYKNPSPLIDEILKDSNGFLVYQEDTIRFLQQVCGLSGSDADNVRRAIGRKDEERLRQALPQILEGYCKKSDQPREKAEEEARQFLKIIEDSASYQFGYNHSIAYCLIGYICAYLRYYYPHEFITSYLNNASNEEDIANGTKLAETYGIKISKPTFGLSAAKYNYDKDTGIIAKGIASIKFMSEDSSNRLYQMSKSKKYTRFIDILLDCKNEGVLNSRQIDNLIKIEFFSNFGNIPELARIRDVCELFKNGEAKSVSKDKLSPELEKIIRNYATDKGVNGNELKTFTITDITGLLYACEDYIKSQGIPDLDIRNKIQNSIEILGYVDVVTNKPEDRRTLYVTSVSPIKSKIDGKIWNYRVGLRSVGTGKVNTLSVKPYVFFKSPLKKGDIIIVPEDGLSKDRKGYWCLVNYYIT